MASRPDQDSPWKEILRQYFPEAIANPFATVVMAHLKAQETKRHPPSRKEWKLGLILEQTCSMSKFEPEQLITVDKICLID